MRKLLLLLLLPIALFAATGDIVSVEIDTLNTVCLAKIEIEGIDTGGTFDFGVDTSESVKRNMQNAKIIFYQNCPSFDNNCDSSNIIDTLFGTNFVRHKYPRSTTSEGVPIYTKNGSNAIVWVALGPSLVYSNCFDITVDISDGFYTNGSTNNSVTGFTVTNNSNLESPKPHGNVTHLMYGRLGYNINNSVISTVDTIRIQGYHRDGRYGCPVKAVKIVLTDESLNSVSSICTTPTYDSNNVIDTLPTIDYCVIFDDLSSLTQGEQVTVDVEIYPWIGDTNSVFYSKNSPFTQPHGVLTSWEKLCDKNNVYGAVAVVDSATGNDGTGVVVAESAYNPGSPPSPFLTMGGAYNAVVAWNNANLSIDNGDGGRALFNKGSYPFAGVGVTPKDGKTYFVCEPNDGVLKSEVIITDQAGDQNLGNMTLLKNLTINEGSSIFIQSTDVLALYNVDRTSTGTAFYYGTGLWEIVGGKTLDGKLRPFSTQKTYIHVRGHYFTGDQDVFIPHMATGTIFANKGVNIQDSIGGGVGEVESGFMSFCQNLNVDAASAVRFFQDNNGAHTVGYSFIQCVFEQTNVAQVAVQIAADQTNVIVNNILFVNCVVSGQRVNAMYADYNLAGLAPVERLYWLVKNNLFDDINIVVDVDEHAGGSLDNTDSTRIGSHGAYHGNGFDGNVFAFNIGAADYTPKFPGLNSYQRQSAIDFNFVDNASATGDGTGYGNYRVESGSIAIGRASFYLPYDLGGNIRFDGSTYADTIGSTAGAYEYGAEPEPTPTDTTTTTGPYKKPTFIKNSRKNNTFIRGAFQ